jgi:hypothetical protein
MEGEDHNNNSPRIEEEVPTTQLEKSQDAIKIGKEEIEPVV